MEVEEVIYACNKERLYVLVSYFYRTINLLVKVVIVFNSSAPTAYSMVYILLRYSIGYNSILDYIWPLSYLILTGN